MSMYDFNPNNFPVLYFHFVKYDGEEVYLRVDTIHQKVIKVQLKPGSKRGKAAIVGFYRIAWLTFISNYLHYGDVQYHKQLERQMGRKHEWHRRLLYTTKARYENAVKEIFKEFNVEHLTS